MLINSGNCEFMELIRKMKIMRKKRYIVTLLIFILALIGGYTLFIYDSKNETKTDIQRSENQMELFYYLVRFDKTITKSAITVDKERYRNDKAAVLNEIFKEVGLTINHVEIAPNKKRIKVEINSTKSDSFLDNSKINLPKTLIITLLNLPDIDNAIIIGDEPFYGNYEQNDEFSYGISSDREPEVVKVRDVDAANHQIKLALYRFDLMNLGEKVMVAVDKELYEKDITAVLQQLFKYEPKIKIRHAILDQNEKRITVDLDGTNIEYTFNAGSAAGTIYTMELIITLLNLPGVDQAIITVNGEKGCYSDHYSFDGVFIKKSETTYDLVDQKG